MRRGNLLRKAIAGGLCLCMTVSSFALGGYVDMKKTAAAADTSAITVDGDDIAVDNVNGLTYKGFGLLTANSTSDLLMDYKAEHPEKYLEMMQYLFGGKNPIFTHVKIEMGNDRDNSTGAESCTKRVEDEVANVKRTTGFQLAADAKKINPDVKVSILRWNKPKWAKTGEQVYTWYKETILAAYEAYGYMVDYINPNTNESWNQTKDTENIKNFAKWIKAETEKTIPDKDALVAYKKIKLIITDEAEKFDSQAMDSLKNDKEFRDAVSVAGYHYPYLADNAKDLIELADKEDMEVWSSENQAVFSDSAFRPANNVEVNGATGTGMGGTGSALEMGNYIIKSFTATRRSHIVYQPVIGSFYQGGEYSSKELVGARDPWSGYIRYDGGLQVLKHVSKFAVTGWENEDNTAGIWRAVANASYCGETGDRMVDGNTGADSYLTLAAPDKKNFSIFFVNNSSLTKQYKISVKNMNFDNGYSLEQYETKAATEGSFDSNYMTYKGNIPADSQGNSVVIVAPFSAVTVSTLHNQNNEEVTGKMPQYEESEREVLDTDDKGNGHNTDNNILYADDFDYTGKKVAVIDNQGKLSQETEDYIENRGGDTGCIPRYSNVINGAFEVVKKEDGSYVLRHQIDAEDEGVGVPWKNGDAAVLFGDFRWTNYRANIDTLFEETNCTDSVARLGIRQMGSSWELTESSGYTFQIDSLGKWVLYRKKEKVDEGEITDEKVFKTGYNVWNNISLEGDGNVITAYVNGNKITTYTDKTPITFGRVGIGEGLKAKYTHMQFDNLMITKIKDKPAYFNEFIDNMQMFTMADVNAEKLIYNDKWSHQCGQGMYVYDRSMSYSTGIGASLKYTFTGTGIDVAGAMNANACTLDVKVDGETYDSAAKPYEAGDCRTNYAISGLEYGKHTVEFTVKSGAWKVDAIGVYGENAKGSVDPEVTTPREDTSKYIGRNTISPKEDPKEDPTPTSKPTPKPTPKPAYQNGAKASSSKSSFQVVDAAKLEVMYCGPLNMKASSVTVEDTVVLFGKTFKVTKIAPNLFAKKKTLKKVTIGKNVREIGQNAFYNCKNLKSIKIKSTVLSKVGKNAIKGINKKAKITCPKKNKKAYKKLFSKKTGYKKSMKIK